MKSSRLASAAVAALALAWSGSARAEDSAYCTKVRARAAGDAALLHAPSAQIQGIRFPSNGAIDTGPTAGGNQYQIRGGLSWSPLDFYKGFKVTSAGDADCERHTAIVTAEELLLGGTDYARLPALRKQASFLSARRSAWETIVQKTDERLAAQIASLVEANDVRARAAELDRRVLQVGGEVQRLEARGIDDRRVMLSQLAASVEATTMNYERRVSHLRSLDAWDLRISGGVVPNATPVDYYGVVQLSFNFGAFSRNANETKYLDARAEELRKARYEIGSRLRLFRDQVKAQRDQTRQELAVIDKRSASLEEMRAMLSKSEASSAPQALAVLDLNMILVESERVFLTALMDELTRLEEK